MVDLTSATVGDMEGKKLIAYLKANGMKPADLAKALGVSDSAAAKYTAAAEWKPAMWATVATGLEKLGLDPQALRGSTTMRRERQPDDLRPLIDSFPASTLEPLRKLLTAGDLERMRVADYIDGLLKGRPVK